MLAAKRRLEPSVIQRLLDEPYRFRFFQTVRMLELWLKQNGTQGDDLVAEYLRFRNSTSLGFPPSEVESLAPDPKTLDRTDGVLLEALQSKALKHIDLTPTFFGFLGGSGTLPSHYSERIAAHLLYEKDESPRAFLDAFSNRAVAMFYAAWRKYRLEFRYEATGKDEFLPILLSLAGVGHSSLHERLNDAGAGVQDQSLGYYAAAMRNRPISAAYIQQIVEEYFAAPVGVEQFIGCWYAVPPDQQTRLGGENAVLGSAAMVGERVWQRDLRLRLTVGPLDRKRFEGFLPGGQAARALEKMLQMFTGYALEYEIQVLLRAEDVQGASLGSGCEGGRLGWDAFLTTQAETQDRADVRYTFHGL